VTLDEVNIASEIISGKVDPDANIIFGMVTDPQVQGEVTITVIATGFPIEETNRVLKLNGPSAVGQVAKPAADEVPEEEAAAPAKEPIAFQVAEASAESDDAEADASEDEQVPLDMGDAVDEDVDLPPFLQRHRDSA
jgi:cell division GTPase FtsZ